MTISLKDRVHARVMCVRVCAAVTAQKSVSRSSACSDPCKSDVCSFLYSLHGCDPKGFCLLFSSVYLYLILVPNLPNAAGNAGRVTL